MEETPSAKRKAQKKIHPKPGIFPSSTIQKEKRKVKLLYVQKCIALLLRRLPLLHKIQHTCSPRVP